MHRLRVFVVSLFVFFAVLLCFVFGQKVGFTDRNETIRASVLPTPPPGNMKKQQNDEVASDLPTSDIFDLSDRDRDKMLEQLHKEIFRDINRIAGKVGLQSLQENRLDSADKEFRIWVFYTDAIGTGLVSTLRGPDRAVEYVRFDKATKRFTKRGLGEPNLGWDGWDKFLEGQASHIVRLDDSPSLDPDDGFIAIEFRKGDDYGSRIFPLSAFDKDGHPLQELCKTLVRNFGPFLCGISQQ